MTPEQTLDWLAQQHFDQCREDRPVQHWIRKMKSELPMQRTWVSLTDKEVNSIEECALTKRMAIAMTSATLKEKNT